MKILLYNFMIHVLQGKVIHLEIPIIAADHSETFKEDGYPANAFDRNVTTISHSTTKPPIWFEGYLSAVEYVDRIIVINGKENKHIYRLSKAVAFVKNNVTNGSIKSLSISHFRPYHTTDESFDFLCIFCRH